MKIQDRIANYLKEDEDIIEDEEDVDLCNDSNVMDRMLEFIINLEDLPEDKQQEVVEIIEEIAPEDVDEGFSAKRVKIKPSEKRKRKREYRKKRAKMKMKARRFRRTSKFKRYQRKKKRKAKSGKTASGKRIRKFI